MKYHRLSNENFIDGEEMKVGNGGINGPVRKISFFLKPFDIITQILPGNIFGRFVEDVLKIIKIAANVSGIAFKGMAGKTAE